MTIAVELSETVEQWLNFPWNTEVGGPRLHRPGVHAQHKGVEVDCQVRYPIPLSRQQRTAGVLALCTLLLLEVFGQVTTEVDVCLGSDKPCGGDLITRQ